jgi:hypothetical protein
MKMVGVTFKNLSPRKKQLFYGVVWLLIVGKMVGASPASCFTTGITFGANTPEKNRGDSKSCSLHGFGVFVFTILGFLVDCVFWRSCLCWHGVYSGWVVYVSP